MAGEPVVTIVGNLTDEPEVRYTPSGIQVATFHIASTPRNRDSQTGEWSDGETLFVRCTAWRRVAENVGDSLMKGARVIVTGRLKVNRYTADDNSRREGLEIDIDEIGPSLRYASAKITKNPKGDYQGGFQGGSQGGFQGGSQGDYQQNQWSNNPSGGEDSYDNRGGGTNPWQDAQEDNPPF